MTPLQRKWYLGILTGHVRDLVAKRDVGLQNVVMQLRKVCNHPYVFPGAEPEPFQEGDHIWQNSGKLALLDRWVTIRCRASRSLFCDVIPRGFRSRLGVRGGIGDRFDVSFPPSWFDR